MGCDQFRQECIELARRNPRVPGVQGDFQGWHQFFDVATGGRGDIDPWRPRDVSEIHLYFSHQITPPVVIEEVPLVEGKNESAS